MPTPSFPAYQQRLRCLISKNLRGNLTVIPFQLLIYDPQEYPDAMSGSLNEIYLNPNEEIFASIHPEQQVGSKLMRDVTPQSRGCVFDDEKKLIFNE